MRACSSIDSKSLNYLKNILTIFKKVLFDVTESMFLSKLKFVACFATKYFAFAHFIFANLRILADPRLI